jgi:hypothetical protein
VAYFPPELGRQKVAAAIVPIFAPINHSLIAADFFNGFKKDVIMRQFAASLRYETETAGQEQVAPLFFFEADSEKKAGCTAAALADSYFPWFAIKLIVRVFENDPNGRPILVVHRP